MQNGYQFDSNKKKTYGNTAYLVLTIEDRKRGPFIDTHARYDGTWPR